MEASPNMVSSHCAILVGSGVPDFGLGVDCVVDGDAGLPPGDGQDDKLAVSDAPGTADEVSVRKGGELALSRFALLSVNPHASNEPN